MSKIKNIKSNSIIIVILSSILIFYLLKDNLNESVKLLSDANLWWIAAAFLLYIGYVLAESLAMGTLVSAHGQKISKWEMFKLQFMSKFFDGITPLSSGGEPFQIYKFKSKGITTANATAIVVEHFVLFQITVVIMGIIAVLCNYIFDFFQYVRLLRYLVLIGFTANTLITSVVLFASMNVERNKKVANFINNILFKIRIVKDKEKNQKKLENFFQDYYNGFANISKNYKVIIYSCLLMALAMIFNFLTVQCVFNALRIPHSLNIFTTIVTGIYIFFIGSFIPTPGGTGGVEVGFVGLFVNFVPKELLPPAMIMWRFITYYAPILVGAVFYNFFPEK